MNPPRRLLIRGVNWLGDAVMTTPALLRLREAYPEAAISLLTPAKLAELWRGHPAVDQVESFQPGESPWTVGRRLRGGGFDLALVMPNSPRSALECWWGRIPHRVGWKRPWRGWLLTQAVRPRSGARRMRKPSLATIRARLEGREPDRIGMDFSAHHTLDYLHLAGVLGANQTPLAPVLRVFPEEVRQALERFGLDSTSVLLGLNPGAEYGPAKRWPAGRFAAVAASVARRGAARWLVFGGARDQAISAQVVKEVPGAVDLAGRTSLRELMALLSACRLLLTNDTGPMHVAAALGVPVVVLFGSTSPELTGPGRPGDPRHRLLRGGVACAPCFLRECPIDFRCMDGIREEQVMDAVLAVMRETQDRRL